MGQRSARRLPVRVLPGKLRGWAELVLPLLLGAAITTPAAAQADEEDSLQSLSRKPPAVCQVATSDAFAPAEGDARQVVAACAGHGLLLGAADDFQVFSHQALEAVLVDLWRGGERRVLLISLQADGRPLLEDLSGQIAMAAGRGPLSDLEGIEIDAASFARDGTLGVRGQAEDSGLAARTAVSGAIDLGRQVAQARAARMGQSAGN